MTGHPDTLDTQNFIAAYLTAALWSSTDESRPDGGDPLDQNYDPDDIAPPDRASLEGHCRNFLANHGPTVTAAIETGDVKCGHGFDAWERAGHDFWLTRNGHGAGFWDGDWPEPYATRLTEACRAWPEIHLYVGDDGRIYFT